MISDGYLAPIFCMLSEVHNANFISFWLKEFVRLGGSCPSEMVMDMSPALLNATVNAFTSHSTLKSYVNALFSLNFNNANQKLETYIRIDIAHFFKAVASCKHFTNSKAKVRESYLRYIGLLMKETDFEALRYLIFTILVVAYSATEGMFKIIYLIAFEIG